mmetsp:Transcript_14099/g.40448  ORF Transcript_14099/g.40448 Transcript_14099/m.40448 type:complete len:82 (+) Transcript_14099:1493-1738(+)
MWPVVGIARRERAAASWGVKKSDESVVVVAARSKVKLKMLAKGDLERGQPLLAAEFESNGVPVANDLEYAPPVGSEPSSRR